MLTFLRKVRKSLIDSGSTHKYLLYAIGEIALVVIGILIALQINNWSEGKKTDKQIEILLTNLVEAIDQDLNYLQETARTHEFRFNSLYYLLEMSTGNLPENLEPIPRIKEKAIWKGPYPAPLDSTFIAEAFFWSGVNPSVVINMNIIEEMKNTGLYSKMENESLKKAINIYYSFVEANFQQEDWNNRLVTSWREFLRDNYGFLVMHINTFKDPMELIKNNETVQVRMKDLLAPAIFRTNNANKAITLAEEVIELVNEELADSTVQ